MIKVFGVGNRTTSTQEGVVSASASATRVAPGLIRIQAELAELELPPKGTITFPDPKNLMEFVITLSPDEGYWKGGSFQFTFLIKPLYPHDAPKVKCITKNVFHPNIDVEGNVCLNILREDWKPVLSISAVIYGLLSLFIEPNGNDPLNQAAAELLRDNKREFAIQVARSMGKRGW